MQKSFASFNITSRERAMINDTTSFPYDEQAMRVSRKLSGGYYVETHNKKVKRNG